RRSKLKSNVLPLHIPQIVQPLPKHPPKLLRIDIANDECANGRHLRLLRPHRERPRDRRAAECSQQFPPSHGDCHTPLPCEVRKWNDSTPRVRSLHVQGGQNAGCCRPASGSKAERLSFPLCPRKRTSSDTTGMSA